MPGHAGREGNRLMTPNDITNALRSREPIAALRAARDRDAIVGWLEQQPGAEDALAAINAGYPADEVVRDFAPDYDTRWEEGHVAGGHVWPYDPKSCPGFRAPRDTDPCANCGADYGSHGAIIRDNGTIEGVSPPPATCPVCGGPFYDATDHVASTGHWPKAGTDIVDHDAMLAHLERVRSTWSAFLDEYRGLFEAFRASPDPRHQAEAYRIDAYQPGGDPGRDWGMGMAATTWFDEFESVIRGLDDER